MKKILCMMLVVCTVLSFAVLPASAGVISTFEAYTDGDASTFQSKNDKVTKDPTNPGNNVLTFKATDQIWINKASTIGVNSIEMDFYRNEETATEGTVTFRLTAKSGETELAKKVFMRIGMQTSNLQFRFVDNANNGAWIGQTNIKTKTWYTAKLVIDKPNDKVYYLFGEKGKAAVVANQALSATVWNGADTLNMFAVNDISGSAVATDEKDGSMLFDNIKVVKYEDIHTALSGLTTAEEVKSELEEYAGLGVFDTSTYDELIFKQGFFDAFVNQTYNTDAGFKIAYNTRIAEYEAFGDLIICNMTEKNGKITKLDIGINKKHHATNFKLIVAAYKGNELVYTKDCPQESFKENTIVECDSLDITRSETDKIKVFAWWNYDQCYPIADATEKQITNS